MFLTDPSNIGLNQYHNLVPINDIEEGDKSHTYTGKREQFVNVVKDNVGNAFGGRGELNIFDVAFDNDPHSINHAGI